MAPNKKNSDGKRYSTETHRSPGYCSCFSPPPCSPLPWTRDACSEELLMLSQPGPSAPSLASRRPVGRQP